MATIYYGHAIIHIKTYTGVFSSFPGGFIVACAWRGAGAVERGGLENRYMRKCIEGSNPSPSATLHSLNFMHHAGSRAEGSLVINFSVASFGKSVIESGVACFWILP